MAIIKGNNKLNNVNGISTDEEKRIMDFLQGAVYCWCKNRKDEWFAVRDLMGGDNFYWEDTPLYPLYLKHEAKGINDSVKEAGKDCGWLLKKVIINDERNFETDKTDIVRKYKWIQPL